MMILYEFLLIFLFLISTGASLKLQIVDMQYNLSCVPYSSIFSSSNTITRILDYVTSFEPNLLPLAEITVLRPLIDGCTVREQNRGSELLNFLSNMIGFANSSQCLTVFIGPPLGGDCSFISDWMIHTDPCIPMLIKPYQISYLCPIMLPVREYVESCSEYDNSGVSPSDDKIRYAEVSVGIQQKTISNTFLHLLRFYGWNSVLLLYEVSSLNAPLRQLADMIVLSFEAKGRLGLSAQVVGSKRILEGIRYDSLLNPWINIVDGKTIIPLNMVIIKRSYWFQVHPLL